MKFDHKIIYKIIINVILFHIKGMTFSDINDGIEPNVKSEDKLFVDNLIIKQFVNCDFDQLIKIVNLKIRKV